METPNRNNDHSLEQIDLIKQSFLRKIQILMKSEDEMLNEQKSIEKEYLPIQENIVRYVQESFSLFKQYLYLFKNAESLLAFSTPNDEENNLSEYVNPESNILISNSLNNDSSLLEKYDAII